MFQVTAEKAKHRSFIIMLYVYIQITTVSTVENACQTLFLPFLLALTCPSAIAWPRQHLWPQT